MYSKCSTPLLRAGYVPLPKAETTWQLINAGLGLSAQTKYQENMAPDNQARGYVSTVPAARDAEAERSGESKGMRRLSAAAMW